MSFLPFLHFFAFLVYLYLAVFVIIKNPKSSLNRVCAAIIACFALWSFGRIFMHNPGTSKETVRLFGHIISVGVLSFSSFFLWFFLIFTQKKKILKTKSLYLDFGHLATRSNYHKGMLFEIV